MLKSRSSPSPTEQIEFGNDPYSWVLHHHRYHKIICIIIIIIIIVIIIIIKIIAAKLFTVWRKDLGRAAVLKKPFEMFFLWWKDFKLMLVVDLSSPSFSSPLIVLLLAFSSFLYFDVGYLEEECFPDSDVFPNHPQWISHHRWPIYMMATRMMIIMTIMMTLMIMIMFVKSSHITDLTLPFWPFYMMRTILIIIIMIDQLALLGNLVWVVLAVRKIIQ